MTTTANSRHRIGRRWLLGLVVGGLLIGYGLFVAVSSYPLSATKDMAGGLALQHFLIFPPAILGGLLIGVLLRRAYRPCTLRWQSLYVLGAVGGLTVVVGYLLLSPAWTGGSGKWYQQAIGVSAALGYGEWALNR